MIRIIRLARGGPRRSGRPGVRSGPGIAVRDDGRARSRSSPSGSWPGSSVGFLLLPYLTVVPAGELVRGVQDMSTAEFVTAVAGPPRRPADRPAARPAARRPARAVRPLPADRRLDLLRPGHGGPDRGQARGPDRGRPGRRPDPARRGARAPRTRRRDPGRRRHERHHRRPHRRHRRFGLPVPPARDPALRAGRAAAHRRQLRHPAPRPRPARPGDPGPTPEGRARRRSRSWPTTRPRPATWTASWSRWRAPARRPS